MGDRAETACRGDGLQSGDARTERDHLRRLDAAGCRGQHRQQNIEHPGAFQHRRIAGDGGLRR